MGITNLLPFLAPITEKHHISEFAGKRIAVDGFVWLHKAAFSCSVQLAADPSTKDILPYLRKKVRSVINAGLTPVIVFDGQPIPMKSQTCAKRHQSRTENLDKAIQLQSYGRQDEAVTYFQRSIEIKFETVTTWIKDLQDGHIEYIVSPYEADGQLAYLARTGYVDLVLTEDSDLLPYQTPLTLFKFDDDMTVSSIVYSKILEYLKLNPDEFLTLCILSGCDYTDHINRMGIKSASSMVATHRTIGPILADARSQKKFTVPENFASQFERAVFTFKHHLVYDPRTRAITPITPIEGEIPEFLGKLIEPSLLMRYVRGEINTMTMLPVDPPRETGKKSPYFKSLSSPDLKQGEEQSRANMSSSPYFSQFSKSSQKAGTRSIASYFSVEEKK